MCGIVGIFGAQKASYEVYKAMLTMQHRGQDAAGILSYHFADHQLNLEKDCGLVTSLFDQKRMEKLPGNLAIGHTRYSTVGVSSSRDLQPMVLGHPHGLGMAHNGNLVNYFELQKQLRTEFSSWSLSQNDVEILQQLLARQIEKNLNHQIDLTVLVESVKTLFGQVQGGYSVVALLADVGLFAFCDPQGIRPLVWGRRKLREDEKQDFYTGEYSYMVASESVALSFCGYEMMGDLGPGELIFINSEGECQRRLLMGEKKRRACMFEWVYFSSPESLAHGQSIYSTRLALGKALAQKMAKRRLTSPFPVDMIVPIPETSRIAAIAMAESLKIPYREVLIKNRYVQRSFILNSQEDREAAVQTKLMPVSAELKGKHVLLVDDSIVRGTTSKNLAKMVRESGALSVTFAVTCAPIRFPCYYGIDFPSSSELVADGASEEQIAHSIGADRVIFLSEEDLLEALPHRDLCLACLNGDYPVDVTCGKSFREQRLARDKRAKERSV